MKKLIGLFLLSCLMCSCASVGHYDEASRHWEVDTGNLKCTFFQGCMHPVWFKNQAGVAFPFFLFADTIKADGKTAFLEEERWAEFRVIENTGDRFIMECKGNFCYGQPPYNVPDEKVSAVYTYEFTRGNPEIAVSVKLTKPAGTAYDVELCSLRWRYQPFETFGDFELKKLPYMESRTFAPGWLHHSSMNFRMGDHKVILLREPYGNTFFCMKDAEGVQHWAAESTELNLKTHFCFEKK